MFGRFFGGKTAEPEKEKDPVTAPNDVYFCRPKLNPNYLLPPFLISEEAAAAIKPPKVVQTLEDRLSKLEPKEKAAYDAMVTKMGPELFEQQTGWTVLRYLIARQWDVEKAFKLLQGTVEWRKTLPTVCKWCTEKPANHMAEFVGWDKEHRPVVYMTYRYALERGDADASEVHMASAFDHAIRMMPEGVTQWVTLVDFATFSILRDSSIAVAKRILGVLSDHFPERLGSFVLVNAISGTFVLFKALSAFIDEKTKSKVKFAYSSGKPDMETVFDDLFPPHLAKYLMARYSENYQNLPLGALEGISEDDIAKKNEQAAKEHKDEVVQTCTLEDVESGKVVPEETLAKTE